MSPSYKVFLRAPSAAELEKKAGELHNDFTWRTASGSLFPEQDHQEPFDALKSTHSQNEQEREPSFLLPDSQEEKSIWILPPATLNAATQRISDMYKNVIFAEDEDEEDDWIVQELVSDQEVTRIDISEINDETRITWPPTNSDVRGGEISRSRLNTTTQLDTQNSYSVSYAHTSTSSIMAFPTFVINLHTLCSLTTVTTAAKSSRTAKWSQKVNLLAAVLEVDGPDTVVIKKGPDAGKDVSVFKLVLGDESGTVCKLTAWREVAERWGGLSGDESFVEPEGVQRGDIAYLQNVQVSLSNSSTTTSNRQSPTPVAVLTASPNLASRLNICYRTLPSVPSDRRFRPDLRLAASDPGLRKVAGAVRWIENVIGLSNE